MSTGEAALLSILVAWPILYAIGWLDGWRAHRDRDESVRPKDWKP